MERKTGFWLIFLIISSIMIPLSLLAPNSPDNTKIGVLNSPISSSAENITHYSVPWLQNSNLTSPITPPWYATYGGDLTDITAGDGNGQANVTVTGEERTKIIFDNQPNDTEWIATNNPAVPLRPDADAANATHRWWASHYWVEQDNLGNSYVSVQWKKNFTMEVNMADYEITSASVNSTVNGTVQAGILQGGGIDVIGDTVGHYGLNDSARFYVRVANLAGTKEYELAYYKTVTLGAGDAAGDDYLYDTLMGTISEPILIAYLTSVLQDDGYNFTVVLGIDIYCDENHQTDEDNWKSLAIKDVNLTFSYEKRIDRGTFAAWNQIGAQLPTGNVQVDAARLDFKYKSDYNWSLIDSPNSEIRILINNNTHTETIKLTKANSTFQEGKIGGFDVTNLILKNVNISLTLQVYLADNFLLTHNITFSFDEIYLEINYTVYVFVPEGAQPPYLNVVANITNLYTNLWVQLSITCENRTGFVDTVWYRNPLNATNYTIDDSGFIGLRTYLLNFTSPSPGAFLFKFWANNSLGNESYKEIYIVWIAPTPPSLSVVANTTSLYTNDWSQITVLCENGSERVDQLWYYNPLNDTSYILASNFTGQQIFLLNFTSANQGPYIFTFWANSSLGMGIVTQKEVTIVWNEPQPPFINLIANISTPYTDHSIELTITCQSGSGSLSLLWFYNPLEPTTNQTLDSNFTGLRTYYRTFTSNTSGSFQFKFWANSTLGLTDSEVITIIWIDPTAPFITVTANKTNPFINEATQLTIRCQSGSGNVSVLWYHNPLDSTNYTLDSDFTGFRTYYRDFTSPAQGIFEFKFWVNSTLGLEAHVTFTIVWLAPIAPILTVTTDDSSPYINQWANITITCRNGTGNVDTLWYFNPLDNINHTLATDFSGMQVHFIYNTTLTPGAYEYKVWANSTYGLEVSNTLTIFWLDIQSPILNVIANDTNPLINEWTQITVTCQPGAGNVDTLWYHNPLDDTTHILATDFATVQVHYIINTSVTAGSYTYEFWANSTFGLLTNASIPVVWLDPTPPNINVIANTTTLYTGQWTQLTITAQSGTGDIDTLWYVNPITNITVILGENFSGQRIYKENISSSIAKQFLFNFTANSTLGLQSLDDIAIVWLAPSPPSLMRSVSDISLEINQWAQITIVCIAGTGNVSRLWYYDPTADENVTIRSNFFGQHQEIIDVTASDADTYTFKFWANSTFGEVAYEFVDIEWTLPPESPIPEWVTYLAIAAIAAIAAIVATWQLYFKVPATIRDIRKVKKAIKAGKQTTPIKVTPRDEAINEIFNKKLKLGNLPSKKPTAPAVKKPKF